MRNPIAFAVALLVCCSSAWAAVPEIDGALSVQALALLGGFVYLLKRRK